MKYRVGKLHDKALTPAFDVERTDDGGIRISNIMSMTDEERDLLLAHYGLTMRGKVVVRGEQHLRSFQPGTIQHFEQASHVLPEPFHLL
jgi:hypothetical protein